MLCKAVKTVCLILIYHKINISQTIALFFVPQCTIWTVSPLAASFKWRLTAVPLTTVVTVLKVVHGGKRCKARPSSLRHLRQAGVPTTNSNNYRHRLFPKITWRLLSRGGDAALSPLPHIIHSLLPAPPCRPLTINSSSSVFGRELAEASEYLNQSGVLIWSCCQKGRGTLWMSWNLLGERVTISLQQSGCSGPFLSTNAD